MNALILAHPERCAVNKADTCTFAKQHLFDEQGQWNCHFFFQFYKAVVGNHFREKVAEPLADMLQIEMLQATIARVVKQNHDNHDFSFRKPPIAMVSPLLGSQNGVFIHHCIIKFAKIICHTENFSNFGRICRISLYKGSSGD